jgi:murein DD-endopeptidase MepM/ murein hydrolase activator NlpD
MRTGRRMSRNAIRRSTGLAAALAAAAVVWTSGCTPLPPSHRPAASTAARGGVYHTVHKGETLWRIAHTYGVSLAEIVEANGLSDDTIRPGDRLFIPGASSVLTVKPSGPTPEEIATDVAGKLSWPLAGRGRGSVTSGFGVRDDPMGEGQAFHKGIDINAPREERVLAAAAGEIVFAGKMSGFGNVVMIDHGNRLITVYGHLSRAIVKLEDRVARGQPIGYVGTSGRATAPHLHFEVRYKGVPVDPLQYLP